MPVFYKSRLPVLYLVFFIACSACKTTKSQPRPEPAYEWVSNWPVSRDSMALSQVTGVGVDTNQNIFLFHRAGREWKEPFPDSMISRNTILMLDHETGKLLDSWGANKFIMPHGLTVDRENNIWVTDVALQQVFKFSHEGKLLMTQGMAGVPGYDSLHFNRPTDVAIAPDGSFYVADGYGNSRIVKFSKEGKYLFEWGKRGNKPGEFHTPHGIDLDEAGNVYVADRDNNRVQVFSGEGKFIRQWENDKAGQLYSLTIDKMNQQVIAIDYLTIGQLIPKGSDIIDLNKILQVQSRTGRSGGYNGPVSRYHDIAVDKDGNIYLGDILGNTIYKFRRKGY